MSSKLLSIVIVNWESGKELFKCLNALKKDSFKDKTYVWVVDNNSSDGSQEILRKKYANWVKVILNPENVGFSKANNQVLKKVETKYSMLLNPDTIPRSQAIEKMVSFMEKNLNVGGCGGLLLNLDGSIQKAGYYRKLPSVLQVIFFYTHFQKYFSKFSFLRHKFWERDEIEDYPFEVEQIPGACFLGRTEVFKKVNFLDEDYFLWFEDVELSFQLRQLGYKLYIIPEARIVHVGGVSFKNWTQGIKKEVRFFSSLFIYARKHFNFMEIIIIRVIVYLSYLYLIITRAIKQLISPTEDRKKFVKHKTEVLKCLLVS